MNKKTTEKSSFRITSQYYKTTWLNDADVYENKNPRLKQRQGNTVYERPCVVML